MPLKQCIHNLTHSLLQQGDFMRRRGVGSPPSAVTDIRTYQSVPMLVKGTGHYCQYKKCPGLDTIQKRARPYKTYYRCDECSIDKGECVWLCNTRKMIDGKPQVVACHLKYHSEK